MKLRDALITQAPSLALQRSAAAEIARQDALVHDLRRAATAAAAALDAAGQRGEPLDRLRAVLARSAT